MAAPYDLLAQVVGRRANGNPNVADGSSAQSVAIASGWLERLGLADNVVDLVGQTLGHQLEAEIGQYLAVGLRSLSPSRRWIVNHPGTSLASFRQYVHLGKLEELIGADNSGVLAATIGRDYEVAPDVTVGELVDLGKPPLLHAVVSCKATIRSDRAQNVRLEAFMLTRHRNGRLPHIVVVTSEPLPSRLASLCRGTGDIDAVYHLGLEQLLDVVDEIGHRPQQTTLSELVAQGRLLDFSNLLPTLIV